MLISLPYQFKFVPGLMSSLITLLLLPMFVYLGHWQWNRMTEKKMIEARLNDPTVIEWHEEDLEKNFDLFRYRTLRVQGQFLNEKNILLDNQIVRGQAGYRVFTAFLPEGSHQKIVLIDRGWIPNTDRSQFPKIATTTKLITLTGRVNKLNQGITLKKETLPDRIDHWPIRLQMIPFEALAPLLNYEVQPFILQLTEKGPYGFTTLPVPRGLASIRHLGYAIQWFTMAAAILIYYLAINLRRRS